MFAIALACFALIQPPHLHKAQQSQGAGARGMDKIISQLRGAYAAFNRGDFDAAVAPLDPKVEWSEPVEFPGGGTYHGRQAVKGYLEQSRAGWSAGSSEPERFIIVGQRIVVFVYAHFRPRDSQQWQQVRLADVYTVQKGRIVQMRAFADRQQALSWAGEKTPVAPQ